MTNIVKSVFEARVCFEKELHGQEVHFLDANLEKNIGVKKDNG